MIQCWQWFYERTRARDQAEASLADTLDVKASILLVVVVFLATLGLDVIRIPGLPLSITVLQSANVVIFAAGIIMLICELWLRKYSFEDEEFLTDLDSYLRGRGAEINDDNMVQLLQNASTEAIARVKRNVSFNTGKQRFLKIAAWLVSIGLFVQIFILLVIGICIAN